MRFPRILFRPFSLFLCVFAGMDGTVKSTGAKTFHSKSRRRRGLEQASWLSDIVLLSASQLNIQDPGTRAVCASLRSQYAVAARFSQARQADPEALFGQWGCDMRLSPFIALSHPRAFSSVLFVVRERVT